MLTLLAWNWVLEHFCVPGSLWGQYLWRSSAIDPQKLQQQWAEIFEQHLLQHQQSGEMGYLERLFPENFVTVEFFYQQHPHKGARCWGRGPGINTGSDKWLSVVGPCGVIGHAQHKKNGFYEVQPIHSKGVRVVLTLEDKEGLFVTEGQGRELRGVDSDSQLQIGDRLVTMACDPYYPPFYPVAEVTDLETQSDGQIFHARPLQPLEHVSYAMVYHRPDLESDVHP